MKLFNYRHFTFILAILSLLLVLSACGGSETSVEEAAVDEAVSATAPQENSGGEPVEPQLTYVDLSPFVLAIEIIEDSTVYDDDKEYKGDTINITLDPAKVRLPDDEQADEDKFAIAEPEVIPIFSVLRTSRFDENPSLHISTKAELPPGAVFKILPGEIELVDSGDSPAFFLNLPEQTIAAAPDSPPSNAPSVTEQTGTEPALDLSAVIDLAPFVVGLTVDFESWDDMGLESYLELVFDGTEVQGVNQEPDNFPTSRAVEKFSIVNPEVIAAATVETSLSEPDNELFLKVWFEKDIANNVVLYIAPGELEITQDDGTVTTGPFVVQVANTTSAPEVLPVTNLAALATGDGDGASASAGDQIAATTAEAGDGPLYPVLKADRWGFINQAGQVVIEPQFTGAYRFEFPTFNEGLEPVNVGKGANPQWGFIDKSGQFVIEPQFGDAKQFSEGLARVKIGEKYGYINPAGEIVIEPQFEGSGPFTNGAAYAKMGETFTFIDTTGQPLSDLRFEAVGWFSEGLAAVETGNKWGFIDKSGQVVIEPQFDKVKDFSEGLAAVQSGSQVNYIDSTGQVALDPQLPGASYFSFSEGLAPVKVGERYGYIDKSGQLVIEPQFDSAGAFSEGLAGVQVGQTHGYIDPSGQMVFQLAFDFPVDPNRAIILGDFSGGLAMIKVSGRYGYVDQSGNFVWKPNG